MEKRIKEKALEMSEAIHKKVEAQIKELLVKRDDTERLVDLHKARIEQYRSQAREMEAEIKKERERVSDLLAAGRDPVELSQKTSELKMQLSEANELIESLEQQVLPSATMEILQIQKAIHDVLHLTIVQLRERYTAELNEKARELEVDILAWHKACQKTADTLKITRTPEHTHHQYKPDGIAKDL